MRVLLVSPYHGGSHAAWAHGLQRHSRHDVELLTLPDRFWKWRMHGGAATLARRFLANPWRPDAVVATDMLDLSTFLALTRSVTGDVPTMLYMHENQLTYPLPADGESGPMRRQGGERDQHYAFINFSSMLAADRIAFNSTFHHDAWFAALPSFLRHFPEHNELGSVELLRDRSCVLPVGIEVDAPDAATAPAAGGAPGDPSPLVIWNQRWEYDKNPGEMIRALGDVAGRGVDFRLAVCGQSFGEAPAAFVGLEATFGERLVHVGYAEEPEYRRLLAAAAVTISTAAHEFFGVAVLEAMASETFAALPDRLSYPELLAGPDIDDTIRERCLYRSYEELVDTVEWALRHAEPRRRIAASLARNARRYAWRRVASTYDEALAGLASHY